MKLLLCLILSICLYLGYSFRFHSSSFSSKLLLSMTVTSSSDLDTLRVEAMSKFVKSIDGLKFAPTTGGVNNIMDYVTTDDGTKYVLRIYNNGLNSKRVEFEHRVLDELAAKFKFNFDLPTAFKSLNEQKTHVVLSSGAEASLFKFIPGALPKKLCVKEIGEAAGQLITAMGQIHIPLESPNPAYYDLYRAHHAISQERFYNEMNRLLATEPAHITKYLQLLIEEIKKIEAFINEIQALNPPLPRQLIHGDLHYDNVLCENGQVTGLLDFEFCAFDWRAMELAVCLSKYADKPDEALSIFTQFMDGFGPYGQLTMKEINIIPECIILRILSNIVYFMGRAVAGEDGYESLTLRAENYYKRIEWIQTNRQAIVDLVKNRIQIVQ